jgi:polyphosphate glucokinase
VSTTSEPTPAARIAIGVDIGGSGIKAAAVDVAAGTLVGERIRVATPIPSTPESVVEATARLVARLERSHAVAATGSVGPLPVGIGIPSVVVEGITWSAANIDQGWLDYPAELEFSRALGRRAVLLNDADAAGVAEMRLGAGVGKLGVVLVLTLGTGLGSGLFVDGVLVPNVELGHMEIRGKDAERRSAAIARVRRGLSWKAWAADLDEHLIAIDRLFSPSLIILGGGVSKNADKFVPFLTVRVPIVAAQLRNDAGIVGAAMVAAERATADERAAAGLRATGARSTGTQATVEPA